MNFKMSPRHTIPLVVFLGLMLLAGLGLKQHMQGQDNTQLIPAALLNKPAPSHALIELDSGKTFSIDTYRGQFVAVNFFASWCLPCRTEVPALAYLSDFFPVIGIAHKDRPRDSQAFLQQYGNPFVRVLLDNDGRAGLQWGSYGIPETYLLDPAGAIVWRHAGIIDRQVIDTQIKPLIRPKS